jgi:hypothetical protein
MPVYVSWALNFADVVGLLRGEIRESFIGYKRSFIPITLPQLGYQVFALSNCAKFHALRLA